MAVVYDAISSAGVISGGPVTFTHTPSGTPRAVVVFTFEYLSAPTTSVTYGGIPMDLIDGGASGSLAVRVFFLGSGIPAGAQAVVVTTSASYCRGAAVSGMADRDTAVGNSYAHDAFNVALGDDASALLLGAIYVQASSLSVLSNCASILNQSLFTSSHRARVCRATSGSYVGWNATTATKYLVAIKVTEIPILGGISEGTSEDSARLAGAAPAPVSQMSWGTVAGSLRYGYGLYWLAVIEGWPVVHAEALADARAPDDYTVDPTLVIDRSARLGAVIQGDSHVAKGFDFELRLLDSPEVRALFGRPARFATLTQDLGPDDTIIYVGNTTPFSGLSEIYVGQSCIKFGGRQFNAFLEVERGVYGPRRAYPKGTIVSDAPYTLVGRRVDLHAVAIDPSGQYVQGAGPYGSVLSYAPVMWSGYIDSHPVRDGGEWVVSVRDQVRRIADPLGVAASGSAVWTPDDDGLVDVPREMSIAIRVTLSTSGVILDARVSPFRAMPATAYASQLRAAIVTALTDAATDAQALGFLWRAVPVDGTQDRHWELVLQFDPDTGDTVVEYTSSVTPNGSGGIFGLTGQVGNDGCSDTASVAEVRCGVWQQRSIHGVALAVILEEGEPAELPPSGHIVVEAAGAVDYARYTGVVPDDTDPLLVHLQLDSADRIFGQTLDQILAGDQSSASVRFLWSDQGVLADILRRALASTGTGRNGAWDSLPARQGLGLPNLDADSFARVFAALSDLPFQLAVDAGTSIAELFDGLFRLTRRAIVTRRRADGSAVDIAAVDIGSVDTAVPVATITDDMLVSSQGRRPVRVKSAYTVPQAIKIACRTIAAGDVPESEGVLQLRDPHLVEWTRTQWDLDVYGVSREDLKTLAIAWALSWFRAGETRQIVELDLPPEVTAQVGDVVELDLLDVSLWDYALAETGYTGLARVLGAVLAPTTAVVTLTVALDGVTAAGPMSPSLPIVAVGGTATAPTSIDVAAEHYALLAHALGAASSFVLLAYRPGADSGHAEYTVTAVAVTGTVCRLTVSAYPASPAVTLTTAHRLTWPVAERCTPEQARYLHNTDVVQWS